MIGQCRRQDNVASLAKLSVLVSKQDLLWVVATRFAMCDIALSATLPYHALYSCELKLKSSAIPATMQMGREVIYCADMSGGGTMELRGVRLIYDKRTPWGI